MPIRKLKERPECFSETAEPHIWIQGYNDKGPYAHMALGFYHDSALVHLEVSRWSPGILTGLKQDWEKVKELCRQKGAVRIIAQKNEYEKSPTWPGFIRHFGFPEPVLMAISTLELED